MQKVIPVIHFVDEAGALLNARQAWEAGAYGILLIYMQAVPPEASAKIAALLTGVAQTIKRKYPQLKVGVNHLHLDPAQALIRNVEAGLDMSWTDLCLTSTNRDDYTNALMTWASAYLKSAPGHLLFSGVAFKHQPLEPNPSKAARLARFHGFIPTTSGPATGVSADPQLIAALSTKGQLALASGVTPENVGQYPGATHLLVATGINDEQDRLCPEKLGSLLEQVKT